MTERREQDRIEPDGTGSGAEDPAIAPLRARIDEVDRDILALLNRRAELAREIGRVKARTGAPVYVASRERDLVEALRRANPGPFPDRGVAPVFREIISATRSLEREPRVAYMGPEGTFSHQAALRQFGSVTELRPAATIGEVFRAVERGEAEFGVVPVENTTEGVVTATLDALVDSSLTLCAELRMRVSHDLMARGGTLEGVRRVASHPQALAQCRSWLERHLPGIERIEVASTAAAARRAADEAGTAAIASPVAAATWGLAVLASGIEDRRDNLTRFLVVGTEAPPASGDDLTMAVFTVRKDQAGALHRLLEPFARHRVNLQGIHARPLRGQPFEYVFFVELEGHRGDDRVRKALEEAAGSALSARVLGSFPRAAGPEPAGATA